MIAEPNVSPAFPSATRHVIPKTLLHTDNLSYSQLLRRRDNQNAPKQLPTSPGPREKPPHRSARSRDQQDAALGLRAVSNLYKSKSSAE